MRAWHPRSPIRVRLRRAVSVAWMATLALLVPANVASVQTKTVRIMLDWIIQGTHAPFFVAQEKGYFKNAGVIAEASGAGKGARNVAVSVASGVYQLGWFDLPSIIKFNAQNPA